MSEAITADIPLKPIVAPKLAAPRPDDPKPEPPAAAPEVPAPPGVLTKLFARFGFTLTRKQSLVVASAVASLVAGVAGVWAVAGSRQKTPSQPLTGQTTAENKTPPATTTPPEKKDTPPTTADNKSNTAAKAAPPGGGNMPLIPDFPGGSNQPGPAASNVPPDRAGPLVPGGGPPSSDGSPGNNSGRPVIPTLPNNFTPPTGPTMDVVERTGGAQRRPGEVAPPVGPAGSQLPPPAGVLPAGGFSPPSGLNVLPPPNTETSGANGGTMPKLPNFSGTNKEPQQPNHLPPLPADRPPPDKPAALPLPGGGPPSLPIPGIGPTAPELGPATGNSGQNTGGSTGGTPGGIVLPPLPGAGAIAPPGNAGSNLGPAIPSGPAPALGPPTVGLEPPGVGGTVPKSPDMQLIPGGAGIKPPDTLPVAGLKPPDTPPPGGGNAGRFEAVKPPGETEVKPIASSAPAREPKTSYDVDIYEPKTNDTYESISTAFYNDAKYAAALRQYNRNAALGGQRIDVPPAHVLKKQYAGSIGTSPAASSSVTPSRPAASEWSASTTQPSRGNTYRVPAGGATFRTIARQTLGSDQEWQKVWDLNRTTHTDPSRVLPEGTEIILPSDARVPR